MYDITVKSSQPKLTSAVELTVGLKSDARLCSVHFMPLQTWYETMKKL